MVKRDFVAQHFLTVADCGPENEWHSHSFDVEVHMAGPELNEHGYLMNIVEVEEQLDRLVDRYEDSTLNDLSEFEGLNPSIEHFARILCTELNDALDTSRLDVLSIRVWEDDHAWASYSLEA